MKNNPLITLVGICMAAMLFHACSKEKTRVANANGFDCEKVALEFAERLAAREYDKAYTMTSQSYRKETTVGQVETTFETMVPSDWGSIGPIETGATMTDWPGKQAEDLGWVYVSIGGDVYSEAVTVVVTLENGEPRIREVEFGRP